MSVRWRTFWAARDPGRGPPGVVGSGPPLMAGAANPPAARVENPPAAGAENPPAAGAENPPAAGASGRSDGACRRGTPGVSGAARYKTSAHVSNFCYIRQFPTFSFDFAPKFQGSVGSITSPIHF
jgi:hypothetical protein